MIWIIFGVIISTLILLVVYINNKYKYWDKKGVPNDKPMFLLGSMAPAILKRQSFVWNIKSLYDAFPSERYCGIYQFAMPTILLRDPRLIKQIAVKDFDHFVDHRPMVSKELDPYFGRSLIALTGQDWRDMRATLSPAFTSSKMKIMFNLIADASEQFNEYFLKRSKETIEIEMKDIFSRFTNDIIATTAFGLKCDSLENRENDFYLMGKEASDFGGLKQWKLFLFSIIPQIVNFLNMKIIVDECTGYFSKLILDAMKIREENGIIRPDLIHLLMEARKGKLKHDEQGPGQTNAQQKNDAGGFSIIEESEVGKSHRHGKPKLLDEDIVAQALLFFIAGFDTSSTLMCYMAYELALNTDIQDRLKQEIDKTLKSCDDGKLTFEALQSMKYMDMVVTETLRKWPPLPGTDRQCVKPYTIAPEKPDEKPLHLKEGHLVWIPIFAIQRDPQYYPDPEKFDPERFNDENKQDVQPCTFVSFGVGPRACIGSRFALMECKTVFVYLLSKFDIVVTKKTQIPVQLSKKHFNLMTEKGMWLGLKRKD